VTVRQIRLLGDPVLRTPADPVTSFDADLRRLVDDLLETTDMDGRAGVAAPQIGVSLRVFSYNVGGELGYVVNPKLVRSEGAQDGDEGCLSLPGLWFPTERGSEATVTGVDVDGKPITVEGDGLMARCLQHETDHLDGIVYIDRLTGRTRKAALRAIREAAE
jgi:peptide deformylase